LPFHKNAAEIEDAAKHAIFSIEKYFNKDA
jgi:hypothetical protein